MGDVEQIGLAGERRPERTRGGWKSPAQTPGHTLCSPLCCTSQGSPVEHLTELSYELQGLTKIFLKGYKVQCFLKGELKIFCAQKIMALRVHFLQLDPFQYILGKTNNYNGCNLERDILQISEYSQCHFPQTTSFDTGF